MIRHKLVSVLVGAVWLGAFVLSYDHIRAITGPHDWTGYVWPIVLDVAVISGTGLLITARRVGHHRAWLALLGLALLLPGLVLSGWANYEAGVSPFLIVASTALPWFVLVSGEALSVLHRTENGQVHESAAHIAVLVSVVAFHASETARLEQLAERVSALPDKLAELETQLSAQVIEQRVWAASFALRMAVREQVEHVPGGTNSDPSPTVPAAVRKQSKTAVRKQSKTMSDEQAIETIKQLDQAANKQVGRPTIQAVTGLGSTRAARLAEQARTPSLRAVGGK